MNGIKNDIGDILIGTMGLIVFFSCRREDNTDKLLLKLFLLSYLTI